MYRAVGKRLGALAGVASGVVAFGTYSEKSIALSDASAPIIVATSPAKLDRVALTNVSPLDGRYAKSTADLCHYFSEFR
jgi:hypothetical protein